MVLPLPANAGVPDGVLQPTSTWGDFNNIQFVIKQALAKMQTAMPVQIIACTNDGGLSPVGFVDVLPLVNQIDGQGNPTPHTTIFNVPYSRAQGGSSAIILDPVPGDIGICVFASRDISKVKATAAQANPGSYRTYSFSDGMYIGGILNGTPTQFVQFSTAGINLTSPAAVVLDAPDVQINASTVEINGTTSVTVTTPIFQVNGAMNVSGVITGAGVDLSTHIHSGVQTGSGDTGPPV